MIRKSGFYAAKQYCCEDISLIENYDKAMNDKSNTVWICHHRKEIELNKTPDELKEIGLYFNRPACELIFLTRSEHLSLHNKGKRKTEQTRAKLSISQKKRFEIQEARDQISKTLKNKKLIPWNKGKKGLQTAWNKGTKSVCKPWNKGTKGVCNQKFKWQTPDGKIVLMGKTYARRYHPDWVLIGPA